MRGALYKSCYHCINGCPGNYPLTEIIYRCTTCGDLLEVQHDLDLLKTKTPQEWRELFAHRFGQIAGPAASGVWDKKEWVCPELEEEHIISIGEGRTPLFVARSLASHTGIENLWVKLCGNSHTGGVLVFNRSKSCCNSNRSPQVVQR